MNAPADTLNSANALARVRDEIAKACASAGRDPAAVTLIAVSKTFPVEAIEPVIVAGQRVFGENRVQEAKAPHCALTAKIAARNGLKLLSMGMSADYATAIAFGATHVRVGTAIFGARAAQRKSPDAGLGG